MSARLTLSLLAGAVFAAWYLLARFHDRLPPDEQYEGAEPSPLEITVASLAVALSVVAGIAFAFADLT